jgi:hypothetical protein
MVFNLQRSRRLNGGFPRKKSEHKKHHGPFMCKYKEETNRCVQSGDGHDGEHCRINENNNCALQVGHEVHHLEKPRKARSPSPTKKRVSSGVRKANPWLAHVAAFRLAHPELSYQEVLKQARPSYIPVKKA